MPATKYLSRLFARHISPVVRRHIFPMPVRVLPNIRSVAAFPCRFSDIEMRVNLANSRIDMPVELFFGDCPFSAPELAWSFNQMLVRRLDRNSLKNDPRGDVNGVYGSFEGMFTVFTVPFTVPVRIVPYCSCHSRLPDVISVLRGS
jgi:hypothetical protein